MIDRERSFRTVLSAEQVIVEINGAIVLTFEVRIEIEMRRIHVITREEIIQEMPSIEPSKSKILKNTRVFLLSPVKATFFSRARRYWSISSRFTEADSVG